MAECLARLVLIPAAFAVWIGQQRERWANRPRKHDGFWTCGRCGMSHFRRDSAAACDHGEHEW